MTAGLPLVYIIILNWNGWKDTIECVDSCLQLRYPAFRILVVDNASSDGSETILRTQFPHIKLIQTGANLGYAGGNNVGISHALANGADYLWLLNNDTKVDPGALDEMVRVAIDDATVGMVGPKILLHSRPEYLNCVGSTINLLTGQPRLIGLGEKDDGRFDGNKEMDGLSGCSLLVSKEIVEKVGLMDERFFLYQAKIWHKVSASIGGHQSPLMLYYMTRNNPLLMRRNVGDAAFARYLLIYLCLVIPKKMINVLIFNKVKRYQKMTALLKGVCDYFCGRFGAYHG